MANDLEASMAADQHCITLIESVSIEIFTEWMTSTFTQTDGLSIFKFLHAFQQAYGSSEGPIVYMKAGLVREKLQGLIDTTDEFNLLFPCLYPNVRCMTKR